jgi:hypothetical protein
MKLTQQEREQIQQNALFRAKNGAICANDVIIIMEFSERGIAPSDIRPRENVFTFNAWKALGRSVKKGEHGVKIPTWIPTSTETNPETGEAKETALRQRTAVVFHESQTKPTGEPANV